MDDVSREIRVAAEWLAERGRPDPGGSALDHLLMERAEAALADRIEQVLARRVAAAVPGPAGVWVECEVPGGAVYEVSIRPGLVLGRPAGPGAWDVIYGPWAAADAPDTTAGEGTTNGDGE